ncbi:MAG: hypothetical protein ACFCUE_13055 [Candidatus Bathyarchaeia archaeon]|jgi:hypothetical protein
MADLNASKKRILLIIVSVLMLLLGGVALIAGGVIMYLNTGNDFEGYALSNTYHIETDSNAFAIWVGAPVSEARLKWVISTDSDKEVFAGWGAMETVNAYTGNYRYAAPAYGWNYRAQAFTASLNITNVQIVNAQYPVMPMSTEIFLDTVITSSAATLYCSPSSLGRTGMLVIMNADASNGIDADIQLGSRIPLYGTLPYILLPVGVVLLLIGVLLIMKSRKLFA